ncbi:MAG: pyridoxal phosphate-dependent aminotransferase family protein [Fibrobacteres bacterium]|nr:pyridoxal phosphate-dependent aminotransferase family protein [Fibrobacterota bacterium]
MAAIPEFAGNDYLGLASHPAMPDALAEGARKYSFSYKSSRSGLGWTSLHEEYERRTESFTSFTSSCILHTTYLGGAVYFAAIASLGVTDVVCDAMAHSNLQMGMRAAGLKSHTYKHLDTADLVQVMQNLKPGGKICIATDSVFGISGEIAPLPAIFETAKKYNAELLIDDAHGFGVFGKTGRGIVEHFSIPKEDRLTVLYTMTKAMGCDGGFLCGREELIKICRASAIINGGAIPSPPVANACLKMLNIFDSESWRRAKLFENRDKMLSILDRLSLPVVERAGSILCIAFKDADEAKKVSLKLLESGIRVPYFKYASEPRDNLLRIAARAVYSDSDLALLRTALSSCF